MLDFKIIRNALEDNFKKMCEENENLFEVELNKDVLWETYLNTIPAKDNKIYRTRREFDCSCCRHFIKGIGNVVAIKDNKMISIWDFETSDDTWNTVLKAMSKFVKKHKVTDVYVSKFNSVGTKYSMDKTEDGNPIKWEHFYLDIPSKFVYNNRYDTIDSVRGEKRANRNVFKRSLDELTMDSVVTVLELINQNSLYRGEEYKYAVEEFRKTKKEYEALKTAKAKELYAWSKSVTLNPTVAKIRNTAIGTLLIDISEGMELDVAVGKYEAVVAPTNYKRSKPIFTQRMLENAQKTITELGYLDSLERRYANADDITVNNILFSNRDTAKRISGGNSLFDALSKETKSNLKKFDRVEEITIDKFINNVLPTVTDIEAYVENKHTPNFVSLIAPVNKDSKTMFKWNNNFSWAYKGNVTDSIVKQNVKNAGGKVDGVLRFSIQWNDIDGYDENDLDAHCIEPNENEIYYGKKRDTRTTGMLDIDIINPTHNVSAVENITWTDINKMIDGTYQFYVHCFTNRGGRSGFRAEIEFNGEIYSFNYTTPLHNKQKVHVANVILKNGQFTIETKLPSNTSSREIWGVNTNQFVPVSVMCYSPNYWDEQNGIGNKHYFFMLKDCVNDELPNAWYSEFLNNELYPNHRKVLEALSSKAHVLETSDQLSGIGFSSTLRNELVVKVKGTTERVLKIKF
jgi:hypothetical protein